MPDALKAVEITVKKGHSSFDSLDANTLAVSITGYPAIWALRLITAKAPNLKVVRLSHWQKGLLSSHKGIRRICKPRNIQIRRVDPHPRRIYTNMVKRELVIKAEILRSLRHVGIDVVPSGLRISQLGLFVLIMTFYKDMLWEKEKSLDSDERRYARVLMVKYCGPKILTPEQLGRKFKRKSTGSLTDESARAWGNQLEREALLFFGIPVRSKAGRSFLTKLTLDDLGRR